MEYVQLVYHSLFKVHNQLYALFIYNLCMEPLLVYSLCVKLFDNP